MMENNRNLRLNIGLLSIGILMILQLVAFSFTYGTLSGQVKSNCIILEQNRILQQDVARQLNDYNARLARIEVILNSK